VRDVCRLQPVANTVVPVAFDVPRMKPVCLECVWLRALWFPLRGACVLSLSPWVDATRFVGPAFVVSIQLQYQRVRYSAPIRQRKQPSVQCVVRDQRVCHLEMVQTGSRGVQERVRRVHLREARVRVIAALFARDGGTLTAEDVLMFVGVRRFVQRMLTAWQVSDAILGVVNVADACRRQPSWPTECHATLH
jgi:hypothetical protein